MGFEVGHVYKFLSITKINIFIYYLILVNSLKNYIN